MQFRGEGLATKKRQAVTGGVFNASGTVGVSKEVPVGVTDLVLTMEDETLERLGKATECYCVVGQSLKDPMQITVRRTSDVP